MGWETSDRRDRLPRDWPRRVENTRAIAGGRCQAIMNAGTRCVEVGTDCDHIEHGDNHDQDNLQWLCGWHHDRKTAREARAARALMPRVSAYMEPERHPGLR
ncbi:HNH endonuclease [Cryobacterium sp. Hh7]|nr:HNH endonuclease [Cryobacterium sp. Hh7]